MNFFEGDNSFVSALNNYHDDLDSGNYDTLDGYTTQSYWKWSKKDELDFFEDRLSPLLTILDVEGVDLFRLKAQLEAMPSIGLPKIADLLATLHILIEQKYVASSEKFEQLRTTEVLTRVAAAMPGPCLIYLDALRSSSLKDKVKLTLINSIILGSSSDGNKFGVLAHLVLKIAINDWLDALKGVEPEVQERCSQMKTDYIKMRDECPSISQDQETITPIEKVTLMSLQQLSNGIGEVITNELRAIPDYVASVARG